MVRKTRASSDICDVLRGRIQVLEERGTGCLKSEASICLSSTNIEKLANAGQRRAMADDCWFMPDTHVSSRRANYLLFNIKVLLQCANYFVIFIC